MKRKYLFIAMFAALASTAHAATKVTVSCTAPTTREDGTAFAASEIGSFLFDYTQPNASTQGPFAKSSCSYVVDIPKGTCFKKGTVFSARVVDNQPTPLTSKPGTQILAEDACNPLAAPSAPIVKITVE